MQPNLKQRLTAWLYDWRKPCLALCFGIILGLLVLEIGLRVARHFFPIDLYSDANRMGGRRPGSLAGGIKLNNFGFRGTDFVIKRTHRFRIVALGDSFAFGVVPYQYNYLTLLEQELRSEGLDAEVLNMGVPSIGPDEYLLMLRHEALMFHPDLVLVSFFIGNGFW